MQTESEIKLMGERFKEKLMNGEFIKNTRANTDKIYTGEYEKKDFDEYTDLTKSGLAELVMKA